MARKRSHRKHRSTGKRRLGAPLFGAAVALAVAGGGAAWYFGDARLAAQHGYEPTSQLWDGHNLKVVYQPIENQWASSDQGGR